LFHPPNDTTVSAVESVGWRIPPHGAVATGTTPLSGVGSIRILLPQIKKGNERFRFSFDLGGGAMCEKFCPRCEWAFKKKNGDICPECGFSRHDKKTGTAAQRAKKESGETDSRKVRRSVSR